MAFDLDATGYVLIVMGVAFILSLPLIVVINYIAITGAVEAFSRLMSRLHHDDFEGLNHGT